MVTYVTCCYRLTPWFTERKHLLFDAALIVLKYRTFLHNSQWVRRNRTQFAVLTLCDDSARCNEMGDYFATEAYTMIDIVCEVDLDKIWF